MIKKGDILVSKRRFHPFEVDKIEEESRYGLKAVEQSTPTRYTTLYVGELEKKYYRELPVNVEGPAQKVLAAKRNALSN